MLAGIGKRVGIAEASEFNQRALLDAQILAVHQWHEQELALVARHRLIPAAVEAEQGQVQRERVGGEGLHAATVQVAGQLVDEDDRREEMLGRFAPCFGTRRDDLLTHGGKAAARDVERIRPGEPALLADIAEPESEQRGGGVRGGILDSQGQRS